MPVGRALGAVFEHAYFTVALGVQHGHPGAGDRRAVPGSCIPAVPGHDDGDDAGIRPAGVDVLLPLHHDGVAIGKLYLSRAAGQIDATVTAAVERGRAYMRPAATQP